MVAGKSNTRSGQKLARGRNPKNKPNMETRGKNYLLQESINLSTDSDRVEAPVVIISASPKDFGGAKRANPLKVENTTTQGKELGI